jgi:hypothetical protein
MTHRQRTPRKRRGQCVANLYGYLVDREDHAAADEAVLLDQHLESLRLWKEELRRRIAENGRILQPADADRVGAGWDDVLAEDGGCKDHETLALDLFLIREGDGRVAVIKETGWPYGDYAETRRRLHAIDPVRFQNEEGLEPHHNTVKGFVVQGFAKKLLAFRRKHAAYRRWSYEAVKKEVRAKLGEPNKCVPHDNQYTK